MSPMLPRLRVQIVSDNLNDAASLTELLRRLSGYDISYSISPAQATAEALLYTPDVVILDGRLPRLDVCKLAEELLLITRESTGTRPLMIAVAGMDESEERYLAAGFDHAIRKPVSLATLLSLLRDHANQLVRAPAEGLMLEFAL